MISWEKFQGCLKNNHLRRALRTRRDPEKFWVSSHKYRDSCPCWFFGSDLVPANIWKPLNKHWNILLPKNKITGVCVQEYLIYGWFISFRRGYCLYFVKLHSYPKFGFFRGFWVGIFPAWIPWFFPSLSRMKHPWNSQIWIQKSLGLWTKIFLSCTCRQGYRVKPT